MVVLVIAVEIVGVLLLATYVSYAFIRKKEMDTTFLSVWFVSNVAQVIGIIAVITNHLFPDRGTKKDKWRLICTCWPLGC